MLTYLDPALVARPLTPPVAAEAGTTPATPLGRIMRIMGRVLVGFVAFLVVGNLVIFVGTVWARHTTSVPAAPSMPGVGNFQVVDDFVWRGSAPSAEGLRSLATYGVTTIIDLRAEEDLQVDEILMGDLGLKRVTIPMRDGQAPTTTQVQRFLAAVNNADGRVFVHCGAGVGRTGTLVASYLVATGQVNGFGAVRRNLAVGPPSLEQLAFAASLDAGDVRRPPVPVVAVSRVLDAPRRIWVNLTR